MSSAQLHHPQGALAGPVAESNRVRMLDVARGLALLGIFLVNIHFMTLPLAQGSAANPASSESWLSVAFFYGTKVFAESKTYPLFSLLFGLGLAMMHDRAMARPAPFALPFVRRQIGLMVFGALHVVLLWYGDILLYYSVIGLVAMLFVKLRAKALAALAAAAIATSMLMLASLLALDMLAGADQPGSRDQRSALVETDQAQPVPPATLERPAAQSADEPPATRLIEAIKIGEVDDPSLPVWRDAEYEAFKHGPFTQAVMIRLVNYLSATVFWILLAGSGVQIFGMFLLGMALHRAGFCSPEHASLRRRVATLGLSLGVPLAGLATALSAMNGGEAGWSLILGDTLTLLAGPVLAVSYLATVGVVVDRGWLRGITSPLTAMGRLALTNYLAQTLITSIIVAHWGLGFFGEFDRLQRVALVFAIYAGQLVFSMLWLKVFTIGPLEWVLRSLTYLHLLRLMRSTRPHTEPVAP